MHKNRQRYTLTEILVAVAVLMLMMTFLMQFVIGSQRIWYASTKTSSLFDKAQVVFSVMETDIKQSLFSVEKGDSLPFYLSSAKESSSAVGSTNTSVKLGFVSQMISTDIKKNFSEFSAENKDMSEHIVKGTMFPVLYHFDRDTYRLYRLALDTTSYKKDNVQVPFVNIFQYFYGFDYKNTSASNVIFDQTANYFDAEVKEILVDDVLDFSIEVYPTLPSGKVFAEERPKAIRITMTLFDHEKYPDYKFRKDMGTADEKKALESKILEDARTFSKIIFLQ